MNKEEWRQVAALVRPEWTEEQFNKEWDEFVSRKYWYRDPIVRTVKSATP